MIFIFLIFFKCVGAMYPEVYKWFLANILPNGWSHHNTPVSESSRLLVNRRHKHSIVCPLLKSNAGNVLWKCGCGDIIYSYTYMCDNGWGLKQKLMGTLPVCGDLLQW